MPKAPAPFSTKEVANGKKAGSALRFNVTSVFCISRKGGSCSGFGGILDAIHVTLLKAGDKVGQSKTVTLIYARTECAEGGLVD